MFHLNLPGRINPRRRSRLTSMSIEQSALEQTCMSTVKRFSFSDGLDRGRGVRSPQVPGFAAPHVDRLPFDPEGVSSSSPKPCLSSRGAQKPIGATLDQRCAAAVRPWIRKVRWSAAYYTRSPASHMERKEQMCKQAFVFALGIIMIGCGGTQKAPPFKPVADTKLLMESVIDPAADLVWDSVRTIITVA